MTIELHHTIMLGRDKIMHWDCPQVRQRLCTKVFRMLRVKRSSSLVHLWFIRIRYVASNKIPGSTGVPWKVKA